MQLSESHEPLPTPHEALPLEIFRILFESAPGLYLVLNPDLVIVAVTDAYLQATMTKREEILGRWIFDVFPDNPDELDATGVRNLRASLERVKQELVADTMAVQKYDIRRPQAEGGTFEERYWSPVNSPVFDAQHQLSYIIHRVEDVTAFIASKRQSQEQQQQTEDLQRQKERMEAEIYERAQQLQAANARLRELEQRKDMFFGMASHELKTPLTMIQATLQFAQRLLKKAQKEEHSLARCQQVIQEVEKLLERGLHQIAIQTRLVNDLLDLARIQNNKLDLSLSLCDLVILAREVVTDLQRTMSARTIQVDLPPENMLLVFADRDRIEQVINNYLTNALKYSSEDKPVNVGLSSDEIQVRLWVQDQGPGLSPQKQQQVWHCFYQVPEIAVRSGSTTGLGLGLYICSVIIRHHGGQVGVESEEGKGSTFWFTLPRAEKVLS